MLEEKQVLRLPSFRPRSLSKRLLWLPSGREGPANYNFARPFLPCPTTYALPANNVLSGERGRRIITVLDGALRKSMHRIVEGS